jgi:hypothetical protein
MIQVKLYNGDATRIIEIVRELRLQGLVQGQDFDFSFNQLKWGNVIGERQKATVFTFYTENWASWFILKYKT